MLSLTCPTHHGKQSSEATARLEGSPRSEIPTDLGAKVTHDNYDVISRNRIGVAHMV